MMTSKQEERFDIFDAEMNLLGTEVRSEVHRHGLWHQTFQCWLWQETAEGPVFLFQKRHPEKDTFPGMLDISSAGHLQAGETVEDGVRELSEELGLTVSFGELISCGIFKEEDIICPDLIDREFCHVFLLRCDQPLADFRLQEDEVIGLYQVPVSYVRQLAAGAAQASLISGVRTNFDGGLIVEERSVEPQDFVPHPPEYYRLLLEKWEMTSGK